MELVSTLLFASVRSLGTWTEESWKTCFSSHSSPGTGQCFPDCIRDFFFLFLQLPLVTRILFHKDKPKSLLCSF